LPAGGATGAAGLILLISMLTWFGFPDGCTFIGTCTGAGADCTGAGAGVTGIAGAPFCGVVSSTEVPSPALRVARIDNESESP